MAEYQCIMTVTDMYVVLSLAVFAWGVALHRF